MVWSFAEAADHESGADEQDQGQSDFDDDEGGAGCAASAGGIGAAEALLESVVDIASRHAEGGEQT